MSLLDQLLDLERQPAARPYTAGEYDLDGFRLWLDGLGAPQRHLRAIHIAGTKGKGSTAAICEALLGGLGFPTALYTSPHLEHFGERFRFGGVSWTSAEFEERITAFHNSLSPELRRGLDSEHPYRTVFEMLTALAFRSFRDYGQQIRSTGTNRPLACIFETGLGGRLDCTNIIEPVVTVITTLGMDHTGILGDTIEKIAAEKAGIIKRARPVVVARQAPGFLDRVWPVICERAAAVGAPVVRAWEHNPVLSSEPTAKGQLLRLRLPDGRETDAELPLRGSFQAGNLEAAVAACWYFAREEGAPFSEAGFQKGIARTNWPGRLEVHPGDKGRILLLDGAHCPLSAQALGAEVDRIIGGADDPRFVLLFGMQRDKQAGEFLTHFLSCCMRARLVQILTYPVPGPRGRDAESLARIIGEAGLAAVSCASIAQAVDQARDLRLHVVAGGTLYAITPIRQAWMNSIPPAE